MKILAISDVHTDPDTPGGPWQEFVARAQDEQPDVLVVAGDLAVGKSAVYETLLMQCNSIPGPKLFVPGNHDLWQLHSKRATWDRYEDDLATAVTTAGWHYLDTGPILHEGVAFIGCMGWYDYSLRQTNAPRPDLRVSPAVVTAPGRGMKTTSARSDLHWEDLTAEDYASKAMQVGDDNVMEGVVWNDVFYTDWRAREGEGVLTDAQVSEYFCEKLRAQAQQVVRRAKQLVVITHFVPFPETLRDYTEIAPAYARAFAGSSQLGDVIRGLPHVSAAIFGHWHRAGEWQIGGMHAYNVSAKNGPGEGTLIVL